MSWKAHVTAVEALRWPLPWPLEAKVGVLVWVSSQGLGKAQENPEPVRWFSG